MISATVKEYLEARLLMWHIAAFCIGIILGQFFHFSSAVMMVILGLALLISIYSWYKKFPYVLLLLAFVVGFAWSDVQAKKITAFPGEIGEPIVLTGKVVCTPVEMENGCRFYLKGNIVSAAGKTLDDSYRILVYGTKESGGLRYGDIVNIEGKVISSQYFGNPGSFNYNTYLASQEVAAMVDTRYQGDIFRTGHRTGLGFMALADTTRNRVYQAIDRIPEESRSFLQGIIFGDKSSLDSVEKTMLSAVGIFHAFAVSGLHVGFVALFMVAVANFFRLKPWAKLLFVSTALLFYGAMANFTPSVTRAVIMSILLYLAYAIGTNRDSYTALAVAAAIILFLSPGAITTAGFQLSFGATWGILYLTRVFQTILPGKAGKIKSSFAVTFAAQFATMPLIAYYYSFLTVGGILLSPIVIPLVGIIVLLGLISCLFSFFGIILAAIPLYSAGLIAQLIEVLCKLVAALPFSYFTVARSPIWLMALFYLILVLLPYRIKGKDSKNFAATGELLDGLLAEENQQENKSENEKAVSSCGERNYTAVYAWAVLAFLVALLFAPNFHWQKKLEVVFLDVGQGSSALITTPQGKHILLDGGVNVSDDDYWGEQAVLPYLRQRGITKLDAVINTHPHNDHTAAIKSALVTLDVKLFITAEVFPAVAEQQTLLALAEQYGVPVSFVEQGQCITLEPGVTMEVFYPQGDTVYWEENANDGSLILKLTYGEVDFLLTGDSEQQALSDIANFPVEAEILLLPHHGSKTGLHQEFYEQVDPEVVIASAGRGNKFGHPSEDVVNYWQARQIPLYRTDLDGAITIETDGQIYEISTFLSKENNRK